MDEVCVCSFEGIFNCLLEKTKISLPVLVTACALGYIWKARKQINDMKKQCVVLEDDMRHIKRENFQLGEEIRRLKCVSSDTELLPLTLSKCCFSKSRPKTKQCCVPKRNLETSPNSPRCISRKMKVRKSGHHSPSCDANKHLQLMSYSTPEVSSDAPCRTSSPKYINMELSPFEWRPQGESTKINANCDECDIIKSGRCSFNDKYFESKAKKCSYGKENLRHNRKRSCSPEPIIESFNCYRYVQKSKSKPPKNRLHTCKSDLMMSCKRDITDCDPCYKAKRKCDKKVHIQNIPFTNCENKNDNCENQKKYDCCPQTLPRSMKLRDKIDRYRSEITKDLDTLKEISNCSLNRKNNTCGKTSFDLKMFNNCDTCEHYSFKRCAK